METVLSAALGAPWWVYGLLGYLSFVGAKASKPHVIPLNQLFILPIVFALLSLLSLMEVAFSTVGLGSWGITLLIGIWLGWSSIKSMDIRVDKQQRLIALPGTWSTLLIILAIFASKYYIGYQLAVDPALLENDAFLMGTMGVSGFCLGLLLGRLFCFIHRFRVEEHVQLERV